MKSHGAENLRFTEKLLKKHVQGVSVVTTSDYNPFWAWTLDLLNNVPRLTLAILFEAC